VDQIERTGSEDVLSVLMNPLTARAKIQRGKIDLVERLEDDGLRQPGGAVLKAVRQSGFTLLEVLVAIAILGLGLTAILSAQTGLFASSTYAERISMSTSMLRCRLSEIELKLNKEGYPLLDMKDEGACWRRRAESPGINAKWKIEKIELPIPPTAGDLSSKLGGGMSPSGLGALGPSRPSARATAPSLDRARPGRHFEVARRPVPRLDSGWASRCDGARTDGFR